MPGPRPTAERLQRLLVMLPWLMQRGSARLDDMAATFHLRRDQLVHDLELAACCGLPPYIDEMVDLIVEDDTVSVGVQRLFTRPLRLTPREGFALLAAGRAALALPGADPHGPLARALDRLEAVLADRPVLAVALDEPDHLALLQQATESGARVHLTYLNLRDERSERVVTPRRVFADKGRWFCEADDDLSGARRTFRVDRIDQAHPTGETVPVEPLTGAPQDPAAALAADAPRATVLLPADAGWVVETYPVDEVSVDPDGRLRVVLPVASDRWLARLLVRLGPAAEVEAPASLRQVGAEAAATVLARYTGR